MYCKFFTAFENAEKNSEKYFDFEIKAFELVSLNTPFYWETIVFMRCEYVNKQSQISDTTNTEFFELVFFQSYQKYDKNTVVQI